MIWIEKFDRSYRPTIIDMRSYFTPQLMHLLETLNHQLNREYRVRATPARYTKKNGWVFPYQLRGITMFSLVIQDEASFSVDDINITDENGLNAALMTIETLYNSGFSEKAEKIIKARKERAKSRDVANRMPEEKSGELPQGSDPKKLNKFHWAAALPPAKLRNLYRSSAKGMLDQDLLDDVGIMFYLRCLQGVDEFALIRSNNLKCHQCSAILSKEEGLMLCSCGFQYTFQEYVRSFNNHRMPGGSALHIFREYAEKWPSTKTDHEKMLLIDWMVHQCHISMSSGLPLRSVVKNLIDAPQKIAEKLILDLAYGDITE